MRSEPCATRPSHPVRTAASRARRLATPALVVVVTTAAAVILAACGSSGSSGKSTSATSTSKTASPTAAVVVKTATNPELGTILVDSDGKTLYTLTANGQAVACTGGCLAAWPPLLLPAGTATATGASGVTGLATVAATGGEQVTQDGLPLYRFSADATAGAAGGEGISSFGGVWHVVKVSGSPAPSGGSSSSTSSTTNNSNPY